MRRGLVTRAGPWCETRWQSRRRGFLPTSAGGSCDMPRNGGSRRALAGNASDLDGNPTYSGVASSSSVPNGSRTNATRWPCGLSSGAASDSQPASSAIR